MPDSTVTPVSTNNHRYPWGRKAPRQHLEDSITQFRKALEASRRPGLTHIQHSVARAAHDARPLLNALEYLSLAGLQRRGGNAEPVTPTQIEESIHAARLSVASIAQSSGWSLKDGLQEFEAAMGRVVELAQSAINQGVEGSLAEAPDPWGGIPDPRRQDVN